jgi:plasmid stabilization system protein ParE
MDYKVIYSPNAISGLAEIVRFVAQDDPQAALRLGKQLADDADSLGRAPLSISNVSPPCKRSEVGHRAIFDLISNCSDSESRGNSAILARGARNPAFVRAKVKRFYLRLADTRQSVGTTPGQGIDRKLPELQR